MIYTLACAADHPRLRGRGCRATLLSLDVDRGVLTLGCRRNGCYSVQELPLPDGLAHQLLSAWAPLFQAPLPLEPSTL